MKAVASENSNAFTGIYGNSGKVNKAPGGNRRDIENEEIRVYLSKLKELVPFMPKNRKLSKLEVIQYVIDYIYDLQYALETHPTLNSAAVHSAAAAILSSQSQPPQTVVNHVHRQPLGVLPPNANVQVATTITTSSACVNTLCSSPESNLTTTTAASSTRMVVSEKISGSSSCSASAESRIVHC